jgi:hypothetical protein
MKINWLRCLCLALVIIGGTVSVALNLSEFEPITGFAPKGHGFGILVLFLLVCFCFSGSCFLIFKKKWYWKLLSIGLFLFGFIFTIPMPSKTGVRIHLFNESDNELKVVISRVKEPERFVQKNLPPHLEKIYHTAPGEYGESLQIRFQSGTNFTEASISDLRKNQVVLSADQVRLQPMIK